MAGVRKTPNPGGNYQGWFTDAAGKRQFFTGTSDRKGTLSIARGLEDNHRQIRLGYRDAPTSAQKNKTRPFDEVVVEYLAWGTSQGGWRGRPWSEKHSYKRRTHLLWWKDQLRLETLADLDGMLPRVEKAVRRLVKEGKTGKTQSNYAEALHAFCNYCLDRGYLAADPLKAMAGFDTTPQSQRRAMTPEEIRQLLAASPPDRRLLYETALFSGLRVNELKNLTVGHLDVDGCGLRLEAEWTKNRKSGFQPLPRRVVEQLQAFAATGEARCIYEATYKKARTKKPLPRSPLLYVPSQPNRPLDADLRAAGIPKHTPKGKLDFHALRVAFINLVLDTDMTVRDAQALARHSTPDMTLNVYGRPQEHRLSAAVEYIADEVLSVPMRATYVQRQAVGAERENATPLLTGSCVPNSMVAVEGFEPA